MTDAASRSPAGSAAPPGTVEAPAIEARDLVKTFGSIRAVDGVSIELRPGRIYGLLGPNGSGKTTLIRLLVGLARPTSGEARLLGHSIPSRELLARVGYMTQADGIYPELSVWENIRFFAGLYGSFDRLRLLDALRVVGLADRVDTPALQLSGGMRRRLSLACALVHQPPVVVLDEPTVGIDPALRVQFWRHFRSLAAAGATLLVSSHVMDEADRCDELLFILAGRIFARGTGAELRQRAGTENLEEAYLRFSGDGGDRDPRLLGDGPRAGDGPADTGPRRDDDRAGSAPGGGAA
jgi:ABC-2 type transport system ATP-binding protein